MVFIETHYLLFFAKEHPDLFFKLFVFLHHVLNISSIHASNVAIFSLDRIKFGFQFLVLNSLSFDFSLVSLDFLIELALDTDILLDLFILLYSCYLKVLVVFCKLCISHLSHLHS